tara:strand:- start:335 stop:550 length:216 start_codon:yes stop_codon:yes gene_type:complete
MNTTAQTMSEASRSRQFSNDPTKTNLKRTASIKATLDQLYHHRPIENYGATGEALMAILKQVKELEALLEG